MPTESEFHNEVTRLFEEKGWSIITDPIIFHEDGSRSIPDFLLHFEGYPLILCEIVSDPLNISSTRTILTKSLQTLKLSYGYIIHGSTNQISEVSADGEINSVKLLPSPRSIWKKTQGEWLELDPRLINLPKITSPLHLHHVLAISNVLDAIISGQSKILLELPIGSGITLVYSLLAWKIASTSEYKRVLILTDRMSSVSQFRESISNLRNESVSKSINSANPSIWVDTIRRAAHYIDDNDIQEEKTNKVPNFKNFDVILLDTFEVNSILNLTQKYDKGIFIARQNGAQTSIFRNIFGNTVYSYNNRDIFVLDDFPVPDGYKTINLEEIADIYSGAYPRGNNLAKLKIKEDVTVYYIKNRDIIASDDVDLSSCEQVKLSDLAGFTPHKYLQPQDIVIPSISINMSKMKVWVVPDNFSSLAIASHQTLIIRVNSSLVNAKMIANYLTSEIGRKEIWRVATSLSSLGARITVSTIGKCRVFVPTLETVSQSDEKPPSEYLVAIQRLEQDVIPELKKLSESEPEEIDLSAVESVVEQFRKISTLLISKPKLEERVETNYPTPIAYPFRLFREAQTHGTYLEKMYRLKDVYEAICFFLYNVCLSDLTRNLSSLNYFIKDKQARRAFTGYSMIHRLNCISEIITEVNQRKSTDLFIHELHTFPDIIETGKKLQSDLRNVISHTRTSSESRQRRIVDEYLPSVEKMLLQTEFLEEYRLVRILGCFYEKGLWHRTIELYKGAVTTTVREEAPEGFFDTKPERNHILLLDTDNKVLNLHPFYQIIDDERTRDEKHICFLKQSNTEKKELEGESVQGAFEVALDGFDELDILSKNLLNKSTK